MPYERSSVSLSQRAPTQQALTQQTSSANGGPEPTASRALRSVDFEGWHRHDSKQERGEGAAEDGVRRDSQIRQAIRHTAPSSAYDAAAAEPASAGAQMPAPGPRPGPAPASPQAPKPVPKPPGEQSGFHRRPRLPGAGSATDGKQGWTLHCVRDDGTAARHVHLPKAVLHLPWLTLLAGSLVGAALVAFASPQRLEAPLPAALVDYLRQEGFEFSHEAEAPSAQAAGNRTGAAVFDRFLRPLRNTVLGAGTEIRDPRTLAARRRARRFGLESMQHAKQLLVGQVSPALAREAGSTAHTPGVLTWPVSEGRFVRGWGSGTGGYHLAVDIAGEAGTEVIAAADGIVGYAGDRIRGFGNIVLLVHPGGWITAYAHNASNLVREGDRVRAGQVIAELGNTGISRGPHVHFELMHRGQNCDPLPLFKAGGSRRVPDFAAEARWTHADRRPKSIRCAPRRRHPHSRYASH